MRAAADAEPTLALDRPRVQAIQFGKELLEIENHAVAEQATRAFVQDAGRNLMQDEFITAHVNGMTRVRATLITGDHRRFSREYVDDLAFSFIAPLGANHY